MVTQNQTRPYKTASLFAIEVNLKVVKKMPHGVGHHGGGRGFGGGGFGGHHHHHHHAFGHHHHHHSYNSRPWGWYGYGYGRGSLLYRRPWSVFWTLMILFVFVAILVSSLTIRSSHSNASNNHGNTYQSRDTALVAYSNRFCDGLSIKGSGFSAEEVRMTLYLLKNKPTNTKQELLSFAKTTSVNQKYEYLMFRLLPKSKITLTACKESGGSVATFFLVKGVSNFQEWKDDGDGHYEKTLKISANCPRSGSAHESFFTYEFSSGDQYYFIFANDLGFSTLQLTFNITQVLYVISPDTVVTNCSVALNSDDSCSIPVAFNSNYTKALLQLEPKQGRVIDRGANNVVSVRCHPRAWFYGVICVSAAVGVAFFVVCVVSACFMYHRRDKLKSRITNQSQGEVEIRNDPVESSAPAAENAPLKSQEEEGQPPPYNYDYNTLPPYKQ